MSGHFGEWMQGRLGPGGPLALVTLSCPLSPVEVSPGAGPLLPPERIANFCAALGVADPGLGLVARLPLGGGTGASTAALLQIARAVGFHDPDRLAAACLAAEGASDPLMLARPDGVLWAPREGRALAKVAPPPAAEIVGGFWGPPLPTDPSDIAFPDIADLFRLWSGRDLPLCAEIASESARRTTTARGPADDPTATLAADLGALGWARAHTGSARALIYAPGTVPAAAEAALAEAGLTDIVGFRTGGPA
ncbi:propanediol utilization protein [Palleronia sp.]|uniref:propanediol utilization protein n=1 Tax=Palleronia sp. TaxID=1940284 RepID=UPI0035C86BE4